MAGAPTLLGALLAVSVLLSSRPSNPRTPHSSRISKIPDIVGFALLGLCLPLVAAVVLCVPRLGWRVRP